MRRERVCNETSIPDVPPNDDGSYTRDALDTSDNFDVAIAEIVKDDDLMAGIDQFDTCMGADIAGSARNHDLHAHHRFCDGDHPRSFCGKSWLNASASRFVMILEASQAARVWILPAECSISSVSQQKR